MKQIFIMGASGTVGTHLIKELKSSDLTITAGTRNPADNRHSSPAGTVIDWVEFDLDREQTWQTALSGSEILFMISPPGDENADIPAARLISSLKDTGIKHIIYLSAMGSEDRPEFSTRKVERLIEDSGIPHTFLRPNFFMQIFSTGMLATTIRNTSSIAIPAADSRLSYIDARDVAAVAARVITNTQAHRNKAYTLTGAKALNHSEIAASISRAVNRSINYQPLPPESLTGILASAGMPSDRIERLAEMYRHVRAGKCEPVYSDTEKLLGRSPIDFSEFSTDYATSWEDANCKKEILI